VLVTGQKLDNKTLLERTLSEFHSKKISIITKPGKKDKGLIDLCKANTEHVLKKDKVSNDIKYKIQTLGKELKIKDKIGTIESYDISHHSGDNAVAGCTVFSNEGKLKKLYRTYNISKENSGNDIGSIVELINRRFSIDKQKEIPSLVIIDGGKTHLSSAVKEFKKLGLNKVNVISISKGVRRKALFDSIHLVNGKTIPIQEGSVFNYFIQEIRDETHRFAIASQKKRRSKSFISSSIDNLSGVGQIRKKLLLRYFGSIEQIKRASVDDLCEVSGIGKNTAQSIFKQIHN
jgi:excinuclease ABC subunit C